MYMTLFNKTYLLLGVWGWVEVWRGGVRVWGWVELWRAGVAARDVLTRHDHTWPLALGDEVSRNVRSKR